MRWLILITSLLLFTACENGVEFQPGDNVPADGAFGSEEPIPYRPPVVRFSEEPGDLIEGENAEGVDYVVESPDLSRSGSPSPSQ